MNFSELPENGSTFLLSHTQDGCEVFSYQQTIAVDEKHVLCGAFNRAEFLQDSRPVCAVHTRKKGVFTEVGNHLHVRQVCGAQDSLGRFTGTGRGDCEKPCRITDG